MGREVAAASTPESGVVAVVAIVAVEGDDTLCCCRGETVGGL